jgi:hypothetical protein
MTASDRAWLLGQLSAAQRGALQGLLEELAQLGIPSAPELLDEVVDGLAAARPAAAGPVAAPDSLEGRLETAEPGLVAQVLAGEPAGFAVHLLGMRAWRWRDEVITRLGAARREPLLRALAAHAHAPAAARPRALDAAVLAGMLDRVAACRAARDAKQAAPPRPAAPATLLQRGLAWWQGRRPRHVEPSA